MCGERRVGAVVARPVEIFSYCVVHRRLIAPKCGRVLRMCETTEKKVIVKGLLYEDYFRE